MLKNSQRGFSLIGVLITIAVMATLILVMTSMISHMNQQAAQTAAKVSAVSLSQDIRMALSSKDHCLATFNQFELPPNLTSTSTQVLANGLNISTVGQVRPGHSFARYNLYVYNLYLGNFNVVSSPDVYTADLIGQFQANMGQSPSKELPSITRQPIVLSKLLFKVDGNRQVTSCTLTAEAAPAPPPQCEPSTGYASTCTPGTPLSDLWGSRIPTSVPTANTNNGCYCFVIVAEGQLCQSCREPYRPDNSNSLNGSNAGNSSDNAH